MKPSTYLQVLAPCCHTAYRLPVTEHVDRERYECRCKCTAKGVTWTITRETVSLSKKGHPHRSSHVGVPGGPPDPEGIMSQSYARCRACDAAEVDGTYRFSRRRRIPGESTYNCRCIERISLAVARR